MGAAFVADHRVNFVEDKRARRLQHAPATFAGQQNVERFRRRHDDVRRPLGHRRAFARGRVAGPDKRANIDFGQTQRAQFFLNPGQRNLQIALNVVAERFERRNVNDVSGVVEFSFDAEAHQIVNGGQKGGQSFTGTSRRGNQSVALLL